MGTRRFQRVNRVDVDLRSGLRLRRWVGDGRAHDFPAGAHEGFEVALIERGAVAYRVGRNTVRACRGEVVLVCPHVEHATTLSADIGATSVWVDRSMLERLAPDARLSAGRGTVQLHESAPVTRRLSTYLRLLTEEATSDEPHASLALSLLSESIALEVLRAVSESKARGAEPRVTRAVAYIQAHFDRALTVSAIASEVGMSPDHFASVFRQHTGSSPYSYVINCRIDRAAELLRSGSVSVSSAAMAVGYRDLSRFSQAFRRRMGKSPSAFMLGGKAL